LHPNRSLAGLGSAGKIDSSPSPRIRGMKLKWIYWVLTGLLAAFYLGGGTLYASNISGVTSQNKCDSIE
jgi:hypothetical protein